MYAPDKITPTSTHQLTDTQKMSRKLGGGRILGSGRSLSSATIVHQRQSSYLSPSESSISFTSQVSNSQVSGEEPDLSSRVSLDNRDAVLAERPTTKLACPICNEDMVWKQSSDQLMYRH